MSSIPPFEGKVPRGYEPPWDIVLSVIDKNPDGMSLEEIGVVFGLTRERVRQIEAEAFEKLSKVANTEELLVWLNHAPLGVNSEPVMATGAPMVLVEAQSVSDDAYWEPSETTKRVDAAIKELECISDRLLRRIEDLRSTTYVPVDSLRDGDEVVIPGMGICTLLSFDSEWSVADENDTVWMVPEYRMMDDEGEAKVVTSRSTVLRY